MLSVRHATTIAVLPFILVTFAFPLFPQSHTVRGSVRDRVTSEPLPAASLRLLHSDRGTIANADGMFELSLPPGRHLLAASFIGYRAETLSVVVPGAGTMSIRLTPSPIQLPDVVVLGEDPAVAIMRKVIERKRQWRDSLRTYTMEAFTRQTIRSDTSIVSITESYTSGYWRSGDTLREVVRQKRSTANVSQAQNFASVGRILNFYEDDIRLAGFDFVGPTSPDAFDYYDFRLEQTLDAGGRGVFVLSLNPKSRLTPLFNGSLSVVDERFVLSSVDVVPNEAFQIPFIPDFQVTYGQQFAPVKGKFWLPVDIRIHASLEISIPFISIPRFSFDAVSAIYDYDTNVPVPDSLFSRRRLSQDSTSTVFDSTYWAEREVLPLTVEEKAAFTSIDSSMTLDKAFKPTGPLADFEGAETGFMKFLGLHFTRVEGLYVGGKFEIDSIGGLFDVAGNVGYGLSDERGQGGLGIEFSLDSTWKVRGGIRAFTSVRPLYDEGLRLPFENTVSSILSKSDYFDYARVTGGALHVEAQPLRSLEARLSLQAERYESVIARSNFSVFYRSHSFRRNPPIDDGTIHSITLSARWGEKAVPFNLIVVKAIQVESEWASPALGGDFAFSRLALRGTYLFDTFLQRSLFPAHLAISLAAGLSHGTLPLQRNFSPETQSAGIGPFRTLRGGRPREFAGTQFGSLTVEHNFRNALFLWLGIPFLYESQVETILHAGVASVSAPARFGVLGAPTNGLYSELGLGLNKLFLLLRLDATYRAYSPAGWHFTLSLGQIL